MVYGVAPTGVYVRIKNDTNFTIDDLYYSYSNQSKQKIGQLKKTENKRLYIPNLNLNEDVDLVIEDSHGKRYVFDKMINKHDTHSNVFNKPNYHYYFLKIEGDKDQLQLNFDEEGRKKFFEFTQPKDN